MIRFVSKELSNLNISFYLLLQIFSNSLPIVNNKYLIKYRHAWITLSINLNLSFIYYYLQKIQFKSKLYILQLKISTLYVTIQNYILII